MQIYAADVSQFFIMTPVKSGHALICTNTFARKTKILCAPFGRSLLEIHDYERRVEGNYAEVTAGDAHEIGFLYSNRFKFWK